MPSASDWYARRLGQQPQAPPTPPIHPGRPDTGYEQQPQTNLQRAQHIAQSQAQAGQESLEAVRSGQGNMMELASHFQGSRAANNATTNCPECGEDRYIRPTPSAMPQCYHCGYNPRFTAYG